MKNRIYTQVNKNLNLSKDQLNDYNWHDYDKEAKTKKALIERSSSMNHSN